MRLVTRRETGGPALVESIPPSGAKLFDALRVSTAIDRAGFVRSSGNTVWWGRDQARIESFGPGRAGWQVDAEQLQRVLLAEAAAAGAHVVRETVRPGMADREVPARYYLDCTGRRGLLARPLKVRQYEQTLRSVALVGVWERRDDWPLPDESHTLIESYEDGWAWSVPSGHGRRQVAVMVDPRTSDLDAGAGGARAYLTEIHKTHRLGALLRQAALVDRPRGWDASMYSASRYVSNNLLLVGDAGSFVDPLSSAGVRKALVSAWVAAIAVHTCLLRPERCGLALSYFDARERSMYQALRRLTSEHLTAASAGHAEAFWQDRSHALDVVEPTTTIASADDVPHVRAVYEQVRSAPSLMLRLSTRVQIVMSGALEGGEIVPKPSLIVPTAQHPLSFIGEVDAVTLCKVACETSDVGVMFDRYCRRAGPVGLPQFLLGLSTALARGWLEDVRVTEGRG